MDEIHCPYCQHEVSVNDVNMARLVGRCLECGKLFDLDETPEFAARKGHKGHDEALLRPKSPQPGTIKLRETARGQEALVRWFGPQYIFLAFFCVFWDGFLVVWYSAVLLAPSGIDIVAALFPLLHVAAGVSITYTTVAGFLNTTSIEVRGGRLRLTHGPLPWPGRGMGETWDRIKYELLLTCPPVLVRFRSGVRRLI